MTPDDKRVIGQSPVVIFHSSTHLWCEDFHFEMAESEGKIINKFPILDVRNCLDEIAWTVGQNGSRWSRLNLCHIKKFIAQLKKI